jgi:hypothetical protein
MTGDKTVTRLQMVWVVVGVSAIPSLAWAQAKPKLLPDRDVDITYRVTDRSDKPLQERVRWLAASHLQRIDGPGRRAVLADRTTDYITILTPSTKSFVKLREPAGGLFRPDEGAAYTKGSENVVAQVPCTEWGSTDPNTGNARSACVTDDGVMLRITENGQTLIQAISVQYRPLKPTTFEIPHGYSPTLIPDLSGD